MSKLLTGRRFGKLTVLSLHSTRHSESYWLCLCDCGHKKTIRGNSLLHGHTRSCGCLRKEISAKIGGNHSEVHGQTLNGKWTPEYTAYVNAKKRCSNPRHPFFKNYGAVGIQFLFDSFDDFLAAVGMRPSPKHSLGRYLDSGNYELGNCDWQNRAEQEAEKKGKRAMLAYRNRRAAA